MKKIQWQLWRYYVQIRSWLPCTWKQKNRFVRELSENVNTFLAQEAAADFQAVINRFGTPQQIAAAYVDETDTHKLLKSLLIRKRIVAIVATCAITGLVACIITLGIQLAMTSDMANGYGVIQITQGETYIVED